MFVVADLLTCSWRRSNTVTEAVWDSCEDPKDDGPFDMLTDPVQCFWSARASRTAQRDAIHSLR
jgi:hypothetical protein